MKIEVWKKGLPRAILVSVVVVAVCVLMSWWRFGLAYSARAVMMDGLLLLPAVWLLVRGSAWRGAPWAFASCVGFLFILGHAIKVSFLGVPITFGDIGPLTQLLRVLHGWRLVMAISALVLVATLLVASLWPRRGGLRYELLLLAYLVALPLAGLAMARHQGNDYETTDQLHSLRREGGTLFVLRQWSHAKAEESGPTESAMRRLLASLPVTMPSSAHAMSMRNVHIVLMESMWDPQHLGAYKFSQDPWDLRMREMWRAGGESTVLSPVFGGATANAEFEVLCGLPATSGRVVFESGMENPLPCLPAILRQEGYLTTANHPYKAEFWSRDKAYARIGFQQYNPLSAYRLDDVDGMFLNDRSAFFQMVERLKGMPVDQPHLAYVVSLSSHYPYDRDRVKRPDRIQVQPANALLQGYANAISYSTSALMDYVEAVRELDPDALIVVFGDHAPMLGNDPDPYLQSGLRSMGEEHPRDGAVTMSATPLIVIDGSRGPVNVGRRPLYALTSLILELLGGNNLPYATLTGGDAAHSRMFIGGLLGSHDGKWIDCARPDESCDRVAQERSRLETLRDDLVVGHQYSLGAAGQRAADAGWKMDINQQYGVCTFSVENWGPRFTGQEQPFNVQSSGNSAFWFKIREARGDLVLRVGEDQTSITVNGTGASASFVDPAFLKVHGEYPMSFRCGDSTPQLIGTFKVNPPEP